MKTETTCSCPEGPLLQAVTAPTPRQQLETVCDAVEAHGWTLFVIEDDGSHAWFQLGAETEDEMDQWNARAVTTLDDLRQRFPAFVFRTNEDYNGDPPDIGCVYIDAWPASQSPFPAALN